MDHLNNAAANEGRSAGRAVILPSSFQRMNFIMTQWQLLDFLVIPIFFLLLPVIHVGKNH
jgi:hypothetical protein